MAGRSVASTADPVVRGDAGFQGATSPPTDLIQAASPRTARATLADRDRELVRRIVGRVKAEALEAFRASEPRRSPLPWLFEPRFYFCCSYCGADSLYGVCRQHRDLPKLERELLAA